MIFGVSSEGNNDGSGRVNVRAVFGGHVTDFPFSWLFIGISSDFEYIENTGQGQTETFFYGIAAHGSEKITFAALVKK
jgi:hypothetical protein